MGCGASERRKCQVKDHDRKIQGENRNEKSRLSEGDGGDQQRREEKKSPTRRGGGNRCRRKTG